MAGTRLSVLGRLADADDRVGRERVGDDQVLSAALDGVAVGEVPRRRCGVGARRHRAARRAVGALLDEPAAPVDLDHRRDVRALRLHLGEIERLGAARRDLERPPTTAATPAASVNVVILPVSATSDGLATMAEPPSCGPPTGTPAQNHADVTNSPFGTNGIVALPRRENSAARCARAVSAAASRHPRSWPTPSTRRCNRRSAIIRHPPADLRCRPRARDARLLGVITRSVDRLRLPRHRRRRPTRRAPTMSADGSIGASIDSSGASGAACDAASPPASNRCGVEPADAQARAATTAPAGRSARTHARSAVRYCSVAGPAEVMS